MPIPVTIVGTCCRSVGFTDIPADETDRQNRGRGGQHQGKPLDQRISARDQGVLEPVELSALQQPVGQRNRDEQQQRRLDHGCEQAGRLDGQNSDDTAHGEADGEKCAEFLMTETGLDGEAGEGEGDCNENSAPAGHTGEARES